MAESLKHASKNYKLTALRPGSTLDSMIAANVAAAQLTILDYIRNLPSALIADAESDLAELAQQLEIEREQEN